MLLRVAPHVGAWIETLKGIRLKVSTLVAPHVGAWIETQKVTHLDELAIVAPHVGAWIETTSLLIMLSIVNRRTSCRCVD